jgi:hypothetical protein
MAAQPPISNITNNVLCLMTILVLLLLLLRLLLLLLQLPERPSFANFKRKLQVKVCSCTKIAHQHDPLLLKS